ncbi:MAG: hypothetical protein H7Z75_02465 [Ferruginibacter sp.]|nr:hypothetical protein [Cytophagales bacterium]
MYFAEKVLGQLFSRREPDRHFSSVSEVGRRSAGQQLAYLEWERAGGYALMNAAVMATYHETGPPTRWFTDVNFFRTESARGFTLVFNAGVEAGQPRHYVDFLRDRLRTLGYRTQHAYCETSDQTRHVETTEKYFLRQGDLPAKRDAAQRDAAHCCGERSAAQTFPDAGSYPNLAGIDLAYVCIDNVPSHCKVMVMTANRQLRDPGVEFNRLMNQLFGF